MQSVSNITVACPKCGASVVRSMQGDEAWRCSNCAFTAAGTAFYLDLLGKTADGTADHYSLQWGEELGYLDFIRANPAAKAVMPAKDPTLSGIQLRN